MKGAIAALIALLIIIFAAFFYFKKAKGDQLYPGEDKIYGKPPVERTEPTKLSIVEELPAETNAMAFAPSIANLATTFKLQGDSLLGFKLPESYAEFCDEIGFNLLDLEELKTMGVDTEREIGFFSTGVGYDKESDEPRFSLTVCVPVTQNPALLDSLDKELTVESSKTKVEKEGYTLYTDTSDDDDFALAVTQKNGYAYLTFGTDQHKTEQEVAKLLKGKGKLSGSKRFNKAVQGLGNSGSFFCYVDVSQMLSDSSLADYISSLDTTSSSAEVERIKELFTLYRGAAFWLDFSGKDFVIRSVAEIDPSNPAAAMYSDNIIQSPIFNPSMNPIGLFGQAFNIKDLFNSAKELMDKYELDELQESLDSINRELGIPEDINLIELVGGNYGIGFYDGKSIGLGTYNGLFSLAVTDEKKANIVRKALHDKVAEELKDLNGLMNSAYIEETKIEGVQTSKLFVPMGGKFYCGVHDKQFIISSEKELYTAAIKGSYKKGFVKNIKDKNLKYAFDKRTMAMSYLDIHESLDIVDNFAGTLSALSSLGSLFSSDTTGNSSRADRYEKGIRDLTKELRSIQYLLAYSQIDKEVLSMEMRIATNFSNSFPEGMADLSRRCIGIIEELK